MIYNFKNLYPGESSLYPLLLYTTLAYGKRRRVQKKEETMNIITHPDIRLGLKCKEVEDINIPVVAEIIGALREKGSGDKKAGLAANQIGYDLRIIIVHGEVFINPVIVKRQGEEKWSLEECLSLPGRRERVKRNNKIRINAISAEGRVIKKRYFKGLDAFCFQHEVDHLDGVLIIDK